MRARKLIDATPVREHLRALSQAGVGRRSIAEACDVQASTLWRIWTHPEVKVHRQIACRILAVDKQAVASGGLVNKWRTVRRIRNLLEDGYRIKDIARWLGLKTSRLPFLKAKRITARTAQRVEKLYNAIERGTIQRV